VVIHLPFIRDLFYYTGRQPSAVEFLAGSALFFRASTFEKAGLFDESTFLDFEELIMAEKVKRVGCTFFVPGASIWHKGNASGSKLRAKRYIENAKSEEYFLSTYVRLSRTGRVIVRFVRLLTFGTRALRYRNYREHFREFITVLWSKHSVPEG
jgi:GT2 family glycosyltransferase